MSAEVQSHGSSIQWRGDFHWTLCVSTLIQSGVDIASDGLTPLLNRGGSAQRFQSLKHFSESFDVAAAPLERHSIPSEKIV